VKNYKNSIKKLTVITSLVTVLLLGSVACIKLEANNEDPNNDIGSVVDKNNNNNNNSNNNNNDRACESNNENNGNTSNNGNNNDDKKDDNHEVIETFLDENNFVTNSDSIEVVVNKERNLKETYVPEDLVKITDVPTLLASPEVNQLRKPAAEALTKLIEAAKEELNVQLYARSGYRSYKTQESTYNGYVKNHGQAEADKFSAKPGQSEHQTGLAMDISSESVNFLLEEEFGDTTEGKWVAENAHKFGFIVRYPKGKEEITGYQYEPWHLRYLGEDLAKKVYESGLTLEQYFFEKNKEQ